MSWRVVYKRSGRPVSIWLVLQMSNVGWRTRIPGLAKLAEDVEIIWAE